MYISLNPNKLAVVVLHSQDHFKALLLFLFVTYLLDGVMQAAIPKLDQFLFYQVKTS